MPEAGNKKQSKTLSILIRDGGVDTLICDGENRRHSTIDVDRTISAPEKVLEEAVYLNPQLLDDFSSVEIIADSRSFTIIPEAISRDTHLFEEICRQLRGDADSGEATLNNCFGACTFATRFAPALGGFISRTFMRASLRHRLACLVDFFSSLGRPANRLKLFADFWGENRLDIIIIGADSLLMANTFDCQNSTDAVYFIMAAVKDSRFDPLEDEVIVCGEADRSTEATDELRRYLNSVMPLLLTTADKELPLELLKPKR